MRAVHDGGVPEESATSRGSGALHSKTQAYLEPMAEEAVEAADDFRKEPGPAEETGRSPAATKKKGRKGKRQRGEDEVGSDGGGGKGGRPGGSSSGDADGESDTRWTAASGRAGSEEAASAKRLPNFGRVSSKKPKREAVVQEAAETRRKPVKRKKKSKSRAGRDRTEGDNKN